MSLPGFPHQTVVSTIVTAEWFDRMRSVGKNIDWSSPKVLAALLVLAILAIVRKWSLVLCVVLVFALAKGLTYLMEGGGMNPGFIHGVVIGVYVFGAILFFFMAVAHFFTRE